MKMIRLLLALPAVLLLGVVGCGKSDKAAAGNNQVIVIDAPQFRAAFSSAPAELKTASDEVMMDIQDSDYTKALMQLEKLANNPSLTDDQKKVVAKIMDQVKAKAIALAPKSAQ